MPKQMTQHGNGWKTANDKRRGTRPSDDEDSSEMAQNPLHEVFLEELADIYNAEQQLIKALPKMAKAAQGDELRTAFEEHVEETKQQSLRLEEVAASVDGSLKRKKCQAMEGLIKEANEMMQDHKGECSLDAVLIAAAQKVEHYEIATYGTLAEWARQMNHTEAADLLKQSLEEESAADEKLTEIAKSLSNLQADTSD